MNTQTNLQALRETISRKVELSAHAELNLRCLTALERVLSHVPVQLDGDLDAEVDGSDLVEVTLDALRRTQLLELASPPVEHFAVLEQLLGLCRARTVPGTKALYALRAHDVEPTLLEAGETLNQRTRAGRVLGRLLGAPGDGSWYIIAARPGTPRTVPMKVEREAAERIAAAARLVDLPLAGVYLDVRGGKTHTLVENSDG